MTKAKPKSVKLTNDNMILALQKYVEIFNEGTPRSLGKYESPSRMSFRALKLHFEALKGAFETVLANQ